MRTPHRRKSEAPSRTMFPREERMGVTLVPEITGAPCATWTRGAAPEVGCARCSTHTASCSHEPPEVGVVTVPGSPHREGHGPRPPHPAGALRCASFGPFGHKRPGRCSVRRDGRWNDLLGTRGCPGGAKWEESTGVASPGTGFLQPRSAFSDPPRSESHSGRRDVCQPQGRVPPSGLCDGATEGERDCVGGPEMP